RGTPIGGLTDGQDYFVVRVEDDPTTPDVDESNGGSKIRLAETEQKAIDAEAWEAEPGHGKLRDPFTIDLTPGATLNKQSFTSADVDANANTISIHPGIAPFEFGQQVIYRENDLPDDYIPADHPDYV